MFSILAEKFHSNPITQNPEFSRPFQEKSFENIMEKGENAGNQHFLLFPQCFLPFWKPMPYSEPAFYLSSVSAFDFDVSLKFHFLVWYSVNLYSTG